MKIAYFTPVMPEETGIADFSEELLMELKKYHSIDVFCTGNVRNADIAQNFNIFVYDDIRKDKIRSQYDLLVFQVGNNAVFHGKIIELFKKYGGVLELHDFSLHNYLAHVTYLNHDYDAYIEAVRYSHGEYGVKIAQNFLDGNARAPWETHALELTVNKNLIDKAIAVVVHSDMAKQMTKAIRPDVPVISIPLHTMDIVENPKDFKEQSRKRLHIKKKGLVFGSFGHMTMAKRIEPTLEALAAYKKRVSKKFHYYIVGKVHDIDLGKKLSDLGLEKHVTVTGFVSLEEFKLYMGACDFCLNLRYPTHGESSASLHRMLGMGKTVVVSDVGSFEEYPDDIVLKVRYDENEISDIYNVICLLGKDEAALNARGEKAIRFAKENCSLEYNARKYASFFHDVASGSYEEEYMDTLVDKLMQIGLTDKDYIAHLTGKKLNFLCNC